MTQDYDHGDDTVTRTLIIHKGLYPNQRKGYICHLINLTWHRRKIESILQSENDDLVV